MKQLGILDSAFINLEQANTPQHVGGLGIYDPSTASGGLVRFKQVIANFERRLQRLPLFRTRLVEVPGGLDRPYWVKDAHFDVEFHLRHIALPTPGDWRQLCVQVARLHARPLDISHPLWEAYIIEGLDNIPDLPKGSFAVYTKMHHALVDGAGGAAFMSALHDLTPSPDDSGPARDEPLLVDREPTAAELLSKAMLNRVKNGIAIARGGIDVAARLGRFAVEVLREQASLPDVRAPRTRFNNSVSPHRVFDAIDFPSEEFRAIEDAAGVEPGDVALAVIGGAMLRYLAAKNEEPRQPLAASLPVNLRARREEAEGNNQVGSIFASLHTDIEEPLRRLESIRASAAAARQFGESNPLADALKLAGIFSPALSKSVAAMWAERHWSRMLPVNTSTIIAKASGPDFDLYCAGARLVKYHGIGVLTPGVGLFHTLFSHADQFNLSVLADRKCMPDPAFYMACLRESHAELLAAARARARAAPRRAAGAAKVARPPASGKRAPAKKAAAKKNPARGQAAPGKAPAGRKAGARQKRRQ